VIIALRLATFDGRLEAEVGDIDQVVDAEIDHQLVVRFDEIEE